MNEQLKIALDLPDMKSSTAFFSSTPADCYKAGGAERKINLHFKSEKLDWPTPRGVFNKLNKEFNFTLDPCASSENTKCARYFTEKEDGLKQSWAGEIVFMNPPYGRSIGKWIQKAYNESLKGAVVVCLIPARTDTGWWHKYCMKAWEIRFIRGRIKFEGAKHNAPFPSAIVIFRGEGL